MHIRLLVVLSGLSTVHVQANRAESWNWIGRFGFEMALKLHNSSKAQPNLLIAPGSIHMVLGNALLGASGDTLREMSQALQIQGDPREGALEVDRQLRLESPRERKGLRRSGHHRHLPSRRLHGKNARFSYEKRPRSRQQRDKPSAVYKFASRVYVSKDLKLKELYRAEVMRRSLAVSVDFKNGKAVQDEINEFVDNATNHLIPGILDQPPIPDTVMVLVSAVYFKASWHKDMSERHSPFEFNEHCGAGLKRTLSTFLTTKNSMLYVESRDIQAVRIPYEGNGKSEFDMLIVLPKPKFECNISNWMTYMSSWDKIATAVRQMSRATVLLKMPKFDLESSYTLNNVLQDMGMKSAFSSEANFSEMTESPVEISEVLHKAKMKVDKHGTEAAAATAVVMVKRARPGLPVEPVVMTVNRSFFVAIVSYNAKDPDFTLPHFIGIVSVVEKSKS